MQTDLERMLEFVQKSIMLSNFKKLLTDMDDNSNDLFLDHKYFDYRDAAAK